MSQVMEFMLIDWLMCGAMVGSRVVLDYWRHWTPRPSRGRNTMDNIRRKTRRGAMIVQGCILADPMAYSVPETWPVGSEAVWARFITISQLTATTGVTVGCMGACSIWLWLEPVGAVRPWIIQSFTPSGTLSLGFMGMLIVSELVQDSLVHVVLVHETFQPAGLKLLSIADRALLSQKLYPAIISAWSIFRDFALPLLASTSLVVGFQIAVPRLAYDAYHSVDRYV